MKKETFITNAVPVFGGACYGVIAFSLEQVEKFKNQGKKVIYVADILTPEHYSTVILAEGALAANGSRAMHTLAVAMDTGTSVMVCHGIRIVLKERKLIILKTNGEKIVLKEGDMLTIDNESKALYEGQLKLLYLEEITEKDKLGGIVSSLENTEKVSSDLIGEDGLLINQA